MMTAKQFNTFGTKRGLTAEGVCDELDDHEEFVESARKKFVRAGMMNLRPVNCSG